MNSDSLCWYSTPDSRAAGRMSVLAVVETILSVVAYWWIAVAYDTYIHLVTSIVIAPLVLLRSDASIARGVELFQRYYESEDNPNNSTFFMAFLIVAACSGIAAWILAETWLSAHSCWALLWRATIVGVSALNIGLAVSLTISQALAGVGAITGAIAGAIAIAAITGVGAGGAAGVGALAIAGAGATKVAVLVALSATFLGPGVATGPFIRAFLIRFWATATHLDTGVQALPANWRDLTVRTDLLQPPELLPGLPDDHEFRVEYILGHVHEGPVFSKILSLIALPILYLPALLYRYSLKSTVWLYLPLIYITHLPARLRNAEGRQIWVRYVGRTLLDRVRFALALFALAVAIVAAIDWPAWAVLVRAGGAMEVPVTALSFFLVLDWGALRPWHWFSLPAAALTLILFFWFDDLRKRAEAGEVLDYASWTLRGAIFLNRLRSLLTIAWIACAFYGFIALAYSGCKLPLWAAPLLSWHFSAPAGCG